jgi:hypothetical protein
VNGTHEKLYALAAKHGLMVGRDITNGCWYYHGLDQKRNYASTVFELYALVLDVTKEGDT